MARIALIGAGSVVFANNLVGDILSYPELKDGVHFALMDIDRRRLEVAAAYAQKRIEAEGARALVEPTTDAREALENADYVINAIQVGGMEATRTDFEVPARHGLPQTIADTHGVGGVFRALRTIPVVLEYARLMGELCPQALLINYSNPMAMNTWAVYAATGINVVGLCHSVPRDHERIAGYLGVPPERLLFRAAGINHLCWFLELTADGKDLYPEFRRAAAEERVSDDRSVVIRGRAMSNRVRFEVLRAFGYYPAESSEHLAEYLPYFIKDPRLVEALDIPVGEYVRRCAAQDQAFARTERLARGPEPLPRHVRTHEYAASIINAIVSNRTESVYANLRNDGMIANLPQDCCVEIPCLVDGRGIMKTHVGSLPPQLAGPIRWHVTVQELTVKAVLEQSREPVYQACYLDPLAGSLLSLGQIRRMVDELFAAHGASLRYLG